MIKAEKLKNYTSKWFRPGYASVKKNGIHGIFGALEEPFIYTRTPKKIDGLDHICQALRRAGHFPLVGEVYIPGMDFEKASGLIRSSNNTPEAIFYIFNCIIPDCVFTDRLNYFYAVKHLLTSQRCIEFAEFVTCSSEKQFLDYSKYQIEVNQEEGTCLISPQHIYQPGKRTWDWMKLVPFRSLEAKVISIQPGTPDKKYANSLGHMVYELENGKQGKVGIFKGQTDTWRSEILKKKKDFIGTNITLEFKSLSKNGIPLQPRFKAFRWDI